MMTIAEARRLTGAKTNYQLSQLTGIAESQFSRWKKRNNCIPEDWESVIKAKSLKELQKP